MHESWYDGQLSTFDDKYADEWDVFSLERATSEGTSRFERRLLHPNDIESWLEREPSEIPNGFRLLLTRHRNAGSADLKQSFIPLQKDHFATLARRYGVPPPYLYLRANANASGAFARYTTRDEDGNATRIGFVLRVPHTPRNAFKSIWSMALTWDVKSGLIAGIFDGLSDHDMSSLSQYLFSVAGQPNHPIALLVFLAETLGAYYTEMRQALELQLFTLERELGITRGAGSGFEGWDWSPAVFREYTKKCDRLNMGPVYLERRLSFLTSFERWLLDILARLDEEVSVSGTQLPALRSTSRSIAETLESSLNITMNELHQTMCLQKRAQMLISTLNIIITQIDSRTNLEIAAAAKHDSTSMITIACLTILFLPATLFPLIVSKSLFGMNMFSFPQPQSSSASPIQGSTPSKQILVSPSFWLYWAITIPLTGMVVVAWRLWVRYRATSIQSEVRSQDTAEKGQSKMVEMGGLSEGGEREEGPFYHPSLRVW